MINSSCFTAKPLRVAGSLTRRSSTVSQRVPSRHGSAKRFKRTAPTRPLRVHASGEGGGPEEEQPKDDQPPQLSARDRELSAMLNKRVKEIESKPFYQDAVDAIKREGVSRRVLFGGLGFVAFTGALLGLGGEKDPVLPLSFYLANILAAQVQLQQAAQFAEQGEYLQYNSIRTRILEGRTDNNLKQAIQAAHLEGRQAAGALVVSKDFMELVDQMDYDKYAQTLKGDSAYEYGRRDAAARRQQFSKAAANSASAKLGEFLKLMPEFEVNLAKDGGANGMLGSTATVPSPDAL